MIMQIRQHIQVVAGRIFGKDSGIDQMLHLFNMPDDTQHLPNPVHPGHEGLLCVHL